MRSGVVDKRTARKVGLGERGGGGGSVNQRCKNDSRQS